MKQRNKTKKGGGQVRCWGTSEGPAAPQSQRLEWGNKGEAGRARSSGPLLIELGTFSGGQELCRVGLGWTKARRPIGGRLKGQMDLGLCSRGFQNHLGCRLGWTLHSVGFGKMSLVGGSAIL